LEEVAGAAQPDTILGWYRKLIARKFDGSRFRQQVGRPRVAGEIERLVVRMAKENPSWGYDRIVGALANLGHPLSDQTVGNILRRHGLSPATKRKQTVSWRDFIRSHRDVLVGMDFFTAETGRPAEVLREGSGIKVDAMGAHVLGRRDSPLAKDLPCQIYIEGSEQTKCLCLHELLIRAVTGTSFFPIRDCARQQWPLWAAF
jgi:hypothetical protein